MYAGHSEIDSSVPFLHQMGSSIRSTGYEKLRDPPALEAQPVFPRRGRFKAWNFFSNLFFGWPVFVICGQLILQTVAWGFFAAVEHRGFIALPVGLAAEVKAHAHYVTMISTMVSTGLAASSSFQDLRPLTRPGSPEVEVEVEPHVHRCIVLTGLQTSGFATYSSHISHLRRAQMAHIAHTGCDCNRNTGLLTAFTVGQSESGYALAKYLQGYPASFTLMDQTFNISTSGILPATTINVDAAARWFPDITTIPSTMRGLEDLPDGLSADYSMDQQGPVFRICAWDRKLMRSRIFRRRNLRLQKSHRRHHAITAPCNRYREGLEFAEFKSNGNYYILSNYLRLSGTCKFPMGKPNYLIMIACPQPADNYSELFAFNKNSLIFSSAGLYSTPTIVCSLSPKITKLNVYYTESVITPTEYLAEPIPDPDGPAGLSAVATIRNMLFFGQASSSNAMGDEIHSLLTDLPFEKWDADTLVLANTVAPYVNIAGPSIVPHIVLSQIFRACLSGINGTFPDGLPADMTIPTSGTVLTQTMGWTRFSASALLFLLPGTLVALATIIVVVVALAEHAGDLPEHVFDPSDALHLVTAAAAGGLSGAFTGTSDEEIEAAERMIIVLGAIPGRGPALFLHGTKSRNYMNA
ncbi:hypothetical protein B0H17DRAFT_1127712 [Mycena rosella]|uniref:Uncharacterized protein n=1 Tax=Mycena rosella TaxID=1033263 RepID=A0AAD7DZS4_MYCRO|nr:hypothetical protein B0H17DRAFT_1127712 [Mycena rosella]